MAVTYPPEEAAVVKALGGCGMPWALVDAIGWPGQFDPIGSSS